MRAAAVLGAWLSVIAAATGALGQLDDQDSLNASAVVGEENDTDLLSDGNVSDDGNTTSNSSSLDATELLEEAAGESTTDGAAGSTTQGGSGLGSGASATCKSAGPGAWICAVPPPCQDVLAGSRACTPSRACVPYGNGTVLCRSSQSAQGAQARTAGQDQSSAQAHTCRPVDDRPDVLQCDLPTACQDGNRSACDLPADCQRTEPGTVTCRLQSAGMPSGAAEQAQAARALVRDHVEDAMDAFLERLDTLRDEHQAMRQELTRLYEAKTSELRASYHRCLEDANRTDAECFEEARSAHRTLRASLELAEQTRTDRLLEEADRYAAEVCNALHDRLSDAWASGQLRDVRLGQLVTPSELGLCSGLLVDLAAQTADGATGGSLPNASTGGG